MIYLLNQYLKYQKYDEYQISEYRNNPSLLENTPTTVPVKATPMPMSNSQYDEQSIHKILDYAKKSQAADLKTELEKYSRNIQKRIIIAKPLGRMSVVQQADYFRMGGSNRLYDVLVKLNLV